MATAPGPTRYDHDRASLRELMAGAPRYRVDQLWEGLYRQLVAPDEITALPRSLRADLAERLPPALVEDSRATSDAGTTCKWLWRLRDGHRIESVLMHYRRRSTVCVSTQAGCAMGCGFCATGQAGFDRNLTTGEIVEQAVRAAQVARASGRRLSNVVFMGMGEPLANFDRTWQAIWRLHDGLGLSARHLTVSTVGLVPGILRLARQPLPVSLAVSLHAAEDAQRDELVPINRRYPLASLIEACHHYRAAHNRRLSLEWALIADTNDRDRDAKALAGIARDLRAHVNLIPLNPTPGYPTVGSPPERVRAFRDRLADLGVNATVRQNRGTDIDAACGQLRASTEAPVSLSPRSPASAPAGPTRRGDRDAARMPR